MEHGEFSKKEGGMFKPGGPLSTEKKREEIPAHHFLMPKERKYPYKMMDGTISCNMLRAAMSRAGQNKDTEVEARARKLFEEHCATE